MHAIRKSIVTDEAMHPIAVQIAYSDWVEIEQSLGLTNEQPPVVDLTRFAGVIHLTEDPLAFQTHIRGEWR